jgi:hypothetical protein
VDVQALWATPDPALRRDDAGPLAILTSWLKWCMIDIGGTTSL